MTSGPNDVSVVVLTRNSARTLDQCLKSIVDEHPGEIIAIDSASTDATLAILRRYKARIISEQSYQYGRSGLFSSGEARRTGALSASGKYVMFVDSDAELTKGCIRKMVDELEKKGWAAIQARVVSKESLSYWQNLRYWENAMPADSAVGPKQSIATVATIFRRDTVLREQFDTSMVYAEDVDLCVRLVRAGYVVGISSTANVYHTYKREFPAFFRRQVAYGRGYSALARKYGSVVFLLRPAWYVNSYLMRSLATGRWNRLPYFVCVDVGIFVGMTTFRRSKGSTVRRFLETPGNPS